MGNPYRFILEKVQKGKYNSFKRGNKRKEEFMPRQPVSL